MKHIITTGNINGGQLEGNIQKYYPNGIDFCYTDPPWGDGNLNYWGTMLKKAVGEQISQINQDQLENIVADTISNYVLNYAFIVYGVKQAPSLVQKLKSKSNVTDIQYYEKQYKSGSKSLKNCVIAVTLNAAPKEDFSMLQNANGIKGLELICKKFHGKYQSCLEMFVGIGYYLKMLDSYGYQVIGNELNSKRLQKALSKIKA